MGTKIVKKLSVKTLVGDKAQLLAIVMAATPKIPNPEYVEGGNKPKEILAAVGPLVNLMTVLGHVTGMKTGTTENVAEPWVKLFGNFKATNLETGEVIPDCETCILPGFIVNGIAAHIKANPGVAMNFGVTLQARYKATSAVGYEFEAENIFRPKEAAPIEAMEALIAQQGIALPAPKVQRLAAPAAAVEAQTINAGDAGSVEDVTSNRPKAKRA